MSVVGAFKKIFHVTPTAFGCEISDHSIRLAYLKPEQGSLTLASYAVEPLPPHAVENGEIRDEAKVLEALQRALNGAKGEKIRTKYVVASLPDPQCFIRIVQLPKLSREEIARALPLEIEANIPLQLADVYYDWEIV